MDRASVSQAYDELIWSEINQSYFGPTGYFNAGYWDREATSQARACEMMIDRVLSPIAEQPGIVLDAGCGLGGGTAWMQQRWPGAHLLGINISVPQLRETRSRARGAWVASMDASQLALASTSVDLVASIEAALHFPSRRAFLAEAFRVLRPGGYLCMTDILFDQPPWWAFTSDTEVTSIEGYRDILREVGFERTEVEDATELCWVEFCHHVRDWALTQRDSGALSEEKATSVVAAYERLSHGVVKHYVLLNCLRP